MTNGMTIINVIDPEIAYHQEQVCINKKSFEEKRIAICIKIIGLPEGIGSFFVILGDNSDIYIIFATKINYIYTQ